MAQNYIGLITKYSTEGFDKAYVAESRSSLLDGNNSFLKWQGAKTVRVGKFQSSGLNNYYRNNQGDSRLLDHVDPRKVAGSISAGATMTPGSDTPGLYGFGYQRGNVAWTWKDYTIRQDRAAQFPIEKFDDEETDGMVIGNAVGEINRTQIVPELDSYAFSTIAGYCSEALGNLVKGELSKDEDAYDALNEGILYMDNHEVDADDQIIFVSPEFLNKIRSLNKGMSRIVQNEKVKGVNFSIMEYEGRKMVSVPPARFRTLIDLSGQGVAWKEGSEAIDFLIVTKSSIIHPVKFNQVKVLEGDMVTAIGFDGYIVSARIYHDLFVLDNKTYGIYCHTGASHIVEKKIEFEIDANKVVTHLNFYPRTELITHYVYKKAVDAPTSASGLTVLNVGDKITEEADTTNSIWVLAMNGSQIVKAEAVIPKTAAKSVGK